MQILENLHLLFVNQLGISSLSCHTISNACMSTLNPPLNKTTTTCKRREKNYYYFVSSKEKYANLIGFERAERNKREFYVSSRNATSENKLQ